MSRYLTLIFFTLLSCNYFTPNIEEDENVIAKVGSSVLLKDDVIYDPSLGDSSEIYFKQVNKWIKKQLVLNSAFQNEEVMRSIQRKVGEYRESLILFEFEKYLFTNSRAIDISEDEILNYYNNNIDDFILPFNLIKAIYAKIPYDAPSISSFRNNLRRYPNSDTTEIISYCYQFAEKSFLEDSTWVKFDDIILNVPFQPNLDKIRFLNSRNYYEVREDNFIHFIRILDKKLVGDFSPISFEEDIINTILLNNRKQELFDKLRDSIFNNSVRGIDYEIF